MPPIHQQPDDFGWPSFHLAVPNLLGAVGLTPRLSLSGDHSPLAVYTKDGQRVDILFEEPLVSLRMLGSEAEESNPFGGLVYRITGLPAPEDQSLENIAWRTQGELCIFVARKDCLIPLRELVEYGKMELTTCDHRVSQDKERETFSIGCTFATLGMLPLPTQATVKNFITMRAMGIIDREALDGAEPSKIVPEDPTVRTVAVYCSSLEQVKKVLEAYESDFLPSVKVARERLRQWLSRDEQQEFDAVVTSHIPESLIGYFESKPPPWRVVGDRMPPWSKFHDIILTVDRHKEGYAVSFTDRTAGQSAYDLHQLLGVTPMPRFWSREFTLTPSKDSWTVINPTALFEGVLGKSADVALMVAQEKSPWLSLTREGTRLSVRLGLEHESGKLEIHRLRDYVYARPAEPDTQPIKLAIAVGVIDGFLEGAEVLDGQSLFGDLCRSIESHADNQG